MLNFQKIDLSRREEYTRYLMNCGERGCEYSLVNLFLWGTQRVAFVNDCLALFSQFQRSCVYPFPIGDGDIGAVLDAILHDAQARGLQCRMTSMTAEDCAFLEARYPGKFCFHPDVEGCDYVYDIHLLANLPGRKFQRKRNHLNRFRQQHPDCILVDIDDTNRAAVLEMAEKWYESRQDAEFGDDYHMEQVALHRAFSNYEALGLEGVALMEGDRVLAMSIGSFLNEQTFDVHFEKALEEVDGAYAAINQGFAAHLRGKYPALRYLNREDDLGLPGLRQSKLSYHPDHMVVKFWAHPLEDDDEH